MSQAIIATGSEGLVASALVPALDTSGLGGLRFDCRVRPDSGRVDIRDALDVLSATARRIGVLAFIQTLESGTADLVAIHLLAAMHTSIGGLAAMTVYIAGTRTSLREVPPSEFDSNHLCGCCRLAKDPPAREPHPACQRLPRCISLRGDAEENS